MSWQPFTVVYIIHQQGEYDIISNLRARVEYGSNKEEVEKSVDKWVNSHLGYTLVEKFTDNPNKVEAIRLKTLEGNINNWCTQEERDLYITEIQH